MELHFQRIDDATHTLRVVGPGARDERVECETRSFLLHDFVHYAVESAGRRGDGFYGRLAAGTPLAVLNDRETVFEGMATIENVVAQVQGTLKTTADAETIFARLAAGAAAQDAELSAWVTPTMLREALEILRGLRGRWRATPFREAMILQWPG